MKKYLQINKILMCLSLILLTLNVPLQIGKCTLGYMYPRLGTYALNLKLRFTTNGKLTARKLKSLPTKHNIFDDKENESITRKFFIRSHAPEVASVVLLW